MDKAEFRSWLGSDLATRQLAKALEDTMEKMWLLHECGCYGWAEFTPKQKSEFNRTRTRRTYGVAVVPGWDVDGCCGRCVTWERFTKRTDGLKLAWLEKRLSDRGISHRRNGHSFHAPILEVDARRLEEAWSILKPVDEDEDDNPKFELDHMGEAYPWDLPTEPDWEIEEAGD